MADPLVTMHELFDQLAAIDLTILSTDQLGGLAIGLGRGIDRLTAFHGKIVHAADERRAPRRQCGGSGAPVGPRW